MAEKSFIWGTGGGGDESPHSEADTALLFAALARVGGANEGVLPRYDGELAVSLINGATQIRMLEGAGIVDGHPYINTAVKDITPVLPAVNTTGRVLVLRCNWAAQTVRAVEVSSADGTATIPTITQTPGTTYDVPLCQYTVTTGGVIGSFVDRREFAGTKQAWQVVADETLASGDAVAALSFTLPAGTKQVRVSGMLNTNTNTRHLWLRLNGDQGANYDTQVTRSAGATVTGAAVDGGAQVVLSGDPMNDGEPGCAFDISISKPLAAQECGIVWNSGTRMGGSNHAALHGIGLWRNTAALLTSLSLLLSSTGGLFGNVVVEAYVE